MRLAAAPGRFARPDPLGNDDPCGERRTILGESRAAAKALAGGVRSPPKLQRRRAEPTASTGPGQKSHVERRKASVPNAGNARRLTQIELAQSVESIANRARPWCAMNARRPLRLCDRERRLRAGHKHAHARCVSVSGAPRRVPRKHPSAIGAPPTPHRGGNSTEPGRKGAPREGKEMARSRREDGKSRGRTCRQRQRGRSRHSRLAVGWRRAPPGRDHARLRAYAEG